MGTRQEVRAGESLRTLKPPEGHCRDSGFSSRGDRCAKRAPEGLSSARHRAEPTAANTRDKVPLSGG